MSAQNPPSTQAPDGATRTIGVAIAIPEPYGTQLQRWRESFGDPLARSIPTHITLVPPVPVDNEAMPFIDEHLRQVGEGERPFTMLLRGTATFRPVSPVVFVALAQGISDCERIAGKARQGPLACDLTYPYHPHVTVAHDLPEEALDRAFTQLSDYEAWFCARGFSLYEHGADGVWRPQRDFPFGGRGTASV